MIERLRRRQEWVVAAAVVTPLVVALVVLIWRPWVPVLDMAMTELRVRDVGGRYTPLVGLPGRIGEFPDQGSHPGPWSFYLVAPFYRIAGSTAWGMELASVVVNAACASAIVVLGGRRFGARGAIVFGLLAAVAIRGYGFTVLTHPWNPYFPVLIWLLALIAAWFVLMGHWWLATVVTVATSIAAQTHIPYLISAVAVDGLVLGTMVVAVVRARRAGTGNGPLRQLLVAVGAAGFVWLPPFAEQLRHGSDGNIAQIVRHFTTEQPEPAIGVGAAGKLVLEHLDAFSVAIDLFRREDAFVHRAGQQGGVSIGGLVVLLLWLAAVAVAVRRRHRPLLALHAVAATALVAGFVSIARIFGKVWFYLTLWMSGTMLLVVVSIGATAWMLLRERGADVPERSVRLALVAATAAVGIASLVTAFGHQVPEDDLAEDVRLVVPDTASALSRAIPPAIGDDGTYIVFWQEAVVPGSQGLALLNELERRGFHVGVDPTWHVSATEHRVLAPGAADAEVHLVSGRWIEEWRGREGFVEVAFVDKRSDADRARFDELERRVLARLDELGRDDLVEVVDTNVFRASLDPGLPRDVVDDLSEMLLIGEPVAVFLAPAGTTW